MQHITGIQQPHRTAIPHSLIAAGPTDARWPSKAQLQHSSTVMLFACPLICPNRSRRLRWRCPYYCYSRRTVRRTIRLRNFGDHLLDAGVWPPAWQCFS